MHPTAATVPEWLRTASGALYREVAQGYAAPLQRLALGYERDTARREELLQDIHFALWRSLSQFDGRCSLRTWVYRVAHNVASTHVMQRRRAPAAFLTLHEVAELPDPAGDAAVAERRHDLERMLAMIERLKPLDRQLVLLYIGGLEGAEIGAVELKRRASAFQRRVAWRNLREYLAGALVIAIFGAYALDASSWLIKLAALAVIAGCAYTMLELHRRAARESVEPADPAVSCLAPSRGAGTTAGGVA